MPSIVHPGLNCSRLQETAVTRCKVLQGCRAAGLYSKNIKIYVNSFFLYDHDKDFFWFLVTRALPDTISPMSIRRQKVDKPEARIHFEMRAITKMKPPTSSDPL